MDEILDYEMINEFPGQLDSSDFGMKFQTAEMMDHNFNSPIVIPMIVANPKIIHPNLQKLKIFEKDE